MLEPAAKKFLTDAFEAEIAAALKNPNGVSAEEFSGLLKWAKASATVAENEGRAARLKSVDPQCTDGIAERGRAEDQEFMAQRLKNTVEALEPPYQAAVKREAREAWEHEVEDVELEVAQVADQILDVYAMASKTLVELFTLMAQVDAKVDALNAKPECYRRLQKTEAVARGVEFNPADSITKKCQLAELVVGNGSVPMLWPIRNNWAAEYYESIAAGLQRLPPTEAERIAASARHVAIGEEMERGHQRLNAEAAARAEANAAELRRQRAGELPRG